MIFKGGVSTAKCTLAMREAATAVEECYTYAGYICVVTSGDEESTKHSGRPVMGDARDPHYEGKALDFRINNVPEEKRLRLVDAIRLALGDDFVVLWEGKGTPNEHLHVQLGRVVA